MMSLLKLASLTWILAAVGTLSLRGSRISSLSLSALGPRKFPVLFELLVRLSDTTP